MSPAFGTAAAHILQALNKAVSPISSRCGRCRRQVTCHCQAMKQAPRQPPQPHTLLPDCLVHLPTTIPLPPPPAERQAKEKFLSHMRGELGWGNMFCFIWVKATVIVYIYRKDIYRQGRFMPASAGRKKIAIYTDRLFLPGACRWRRRW